MVVGSKMDMLSDVNCQRNLVDDLMMGESNGNLEDSLKSEIESMLRVQHYRNMIDQERDLNICRSGSAPPTVEGSMSAVGSLIMNPNFSGHSHGDSSSINGFLSEDEIRSHPAYLSYYYSNDNLNPRLPPPLLSREDWRVAQRFQGMGSSFGGIGDLRKKNLVGDSGDSSSLFSMQPGLSLQQQVEDELMELRKAAAMNPSAKWLNRGLGSSASDVLISTFGAGLGARRKSFADILQEGLDQPASLSGHLSRPASHNAFGEIVNTKSNSNPLSAELSCGMKHKGMPRVQSLGSVVSHSFASASGSSLSRSRTPDIPPGLTRVCPVEKNAIYSNALNNGLLSSTAEIADIAASLSGLNFSKKQIGDEDAKSRLLETDKHHLFNMSNGHNARPEKLIVPTNYTDLARKGRIVNFDEQVNFPKRVASSASLSSIASPPGFSTLEGSKNHSPTDNIPRSDSPSHVSGGYSANLDFSSHVPGSTLTGTRQSLSRNGNHVGSDLHSTPIDTHYIRYLQGASDYATHDSARQGDPSQGSNYFGTTRGDLQELQRAYVESLLAQQKKQYELPLLGKSGGLNHGHYVGPEFGLGIQYPGNPMKNSVLPSVASGGPTFQNEQMSRFTSMLRSPMGGSAKSWHSDSGTNLEGKLASSLLEELKNNKNRSFELSDIIDHVVEFSTDQYGSRFIQQKLETAAAEEKAKIFAEIMPHSRTLMTDVFGNYVIQKFFEHGSESQRKELASQLTGHVLPLSLQMYGCRVIQKALEVVGVNQQTQMVAELDGSVMKCVRDQNGNHVIQKCIECVPQDRVQFIISAFFGQVVVLSTHPYGCRVIQRVLEHCDDPNTQQTIMEEVMQSVCTLAQDQYGNYVIQHVLQHGKPQERTAIISKLAGQIVKMSQQKFASNVVEKCLSFGGPKERQILVNEMLGTTDENEPLQAMMKDPFGNYVVQKVLETCDDQSRELILSRIKVHLNTLKRYTYGKHIVSRVEKLVAAGERCIGLSSSHSS